MNVEVERLPHCQCRLIVTLSVEEVDRAYAAATRRIGKQASVPGFRPGKVPAAMLERRYGPTIQQEASESIIRSTLFVAIEQHQLKTFEQPTVESMDFKRGATGRYVASVELFPEIQGLRYKDVPAPSFTEPQVDDKQVDARIERERTALAQTVPVEGRNTIEMGDYVLADYAGSQDGTPIERSSQEGALLHIQEGSFIPGFIEGLVGQTVPGQATVNLTFPEEYGQADLAGKPAQFQFTLHELKMQRLPALDDEFARDAGHESLAAMRQTFVDELQKTARAEADGKNDDAILEALVAHNPFEMASGIIDRRVEDLIGEREQQLQSMIGPSYKVSDDERIDLRTSLRPQAEHSVRASLLISEVAKAAEIEVTEADMDAFIDDWRTRREAQGEPTGEGYDAYVHSEAGRNAIRFEVSRRKVMELLRQATGAPAVAS